MWSLCGRRRALCPFSKRNQGPGACLHCWRGVGSLFASHSASVGGRDGDPVFSSACCFSAGSVLWANSFFAGAFFAATCVFTTAGWLGSAGVFTAAGRLGSTGAFEAAFTTTGRVGSTCFATRTGGGGGFGAGVSTATGFGKGGKASGAICATASAGAGAGGGAI